ncbi:MAG: flagellar motor protein MotA [Lentilitoribacter sp.]
MANSTWDQVSENGKAPNKLSSPIVFLFSVLISLVFVGFAVAVLFRQVQTAFLANPGLNGLIIFVLFAGVLLAIRQITQLRPEVRWVNSFRAAGDADKVSRDPILLAPMRVLFSGQREKALSTSSLRSILDSIANRLDESRDTTRYLIGLLVFLGLLGTFWGLLGTIGSIKDVIGSLDAGSGNTEDVLAALKTGLGAPLDGMGTAFSSSLFGLAGSLILGFIDLQAGWAQSRFYAELENWLASVTDVTSDVGSTNVPTITTSADSSEELKAVAEHLKNLSVDGGTNQRTTAAMANLAEGIQGLVKNMRNEQQMLRDWIDAQQAESKSMRVTLDKLADRIKDK